MNEHPARELHDEGTTEVEADVLYVIEDDPPALRPRWYCHEYPPASMPSTTPSRGFFPGLVPWSCGHSLRTSTGPARNPVNAEMAKVQMRPWPPPANERAQIDAIYAGAVLAKQLPKTTREVLTSRLGMRGLQNTRASTPAQSRRIRVSIEVPGGGAVDFEEWESGAVCSGRATNSGPIAFGAAPDVIATTSGRHPAAPGSSPLLQRSTTSEPGAPSAVEASSTCASEPAKCSISQLAANRDSIREHGLDWRAMRGRGIAGSQGPELDAIFLLQVSR